MKSFMTLNQASLGGMRRRVDRPLSPPSRGVSLHSSLLARRLDSKTQAELKTGEKVRRTDEGETICNAA